ncbi:MAG: acetolactate decarboxylase [Bacteroidota bacterium]
MTRSLFHTVLVCSTALLIFSCRSTTHKEQVNDPSPKIVGAMKNVMRKGELFATINVDTIANKEHLYGLGPVAFLAGEIIILDGTAYRSQVINDTVMQVTKTFHLQAPFFGYAHIRDWVQCPIPDSVQTILQLETYLDTATKHFPRPFFFKILANMDSASVHVVDLPAGTKVSSPEDARIGQRHYKVTNSNVELLGFFSTQHQAIFTHHDTYVHMHLISEDRKLMGHLDTMHISKGTAKLLLPKY